MRSNTANVHVLWIDRRHAAYAGGLVDALPAQFVVFSATVSDSVVHVIRSLNPDVVCVEFDDPDETDLRVVPIVTRMFPSLPLLMFTDRHSEALSVWAFRSGVCDYRVKPFKPAILAKSIAYASVAKAPRGVAMPSDLIAPSNHLHAAVATSKTSNAVAFIAEHYAQRITQATTASLCHLSTSHFSRTFRREHGVSFERFLLEYRLAKGRELLGMTSLAVTQVAHSVGFNDASYFARMFKRSTGLTPARYRLGARSYSGLPALRCSAAAVQHPAELS